MVNVERAARSIGKLSLLKFFPSDPDARTALVEMACAMVETDEEIEWLCRRALQIFNEWPGPNELRALYCSRYPAQDGVSANSELFSTGYPPDPAFPRREEWIPQLPAGRRISGDINIENAVILLAEEKRMAPPLRDHAKRRSSDDVAKMLEQMGL